MIHGIGLSKSYGNLEVLKSVDISIHAGEIVSITGPSGAGKSTLLQLLGTLDVPQNGSIKYDGIEVSSLKAKNMANFRNDNIGFIFQFHHLLPEFTAIENVCMPAFIKGLSKSDAEFRAKELLTVLGLADRLEHKPNELSGGEQQRVAVARALMNKPKVIFADEPSGNLDTENANELHNLFLKLRDEYGQTFVIVTHNQELADMADRCIQMKDGQVVL
ncbi:MAG TPA: lipoprotein-releasing system ATP-binding protein LolD [Bacteroidetes bacterium]|jgi:lipoprotein-releasing system ATP-binding protein|nr:lipoprotein-releasing system ATP-binding protein LolD [Bacteroidota bacterium]|tara:strand:- start:1627 stop:2280 length:654 start_codon:yes stop_codon:yes gene_type:complete